MEPAVVLAALAANSVAELLAAASVLGLLPQLSVAIGSHPSLYLPLAT